MSNIKDYISIIKPIKNMYNTLNIKSDINGKLRIRRRFVQRLSDNEIIIVPEIMNLKNNLQFNRVETIHDYSYFDDIILRSKYGYKLKIEHLKNNKSIVRVNKRMYVLNR